MARAVLLLAAAAQALVAPRRHALRPANRFAATPKADVMKCLEREYRSFFAPLEDAYYEAGVTFDDPLSSLAGLDAYRGNVDLLAGRTFLGGVLFDDAAIALHDVAENGAGVRTRWTLRVEFKALPWRPVARFTGVSDYELGPDGRIRGQVDYWDSVDLRRGGAYERSPKAAALKDFVGQLFGPGATDGELPYELLRRAGDYVVRRYPEASVAEVAYEARPEGYDQLGSYCGGFNEAKERMTPFLPSIIAVPRGAGASGAQKTMTWPVRLAKSPPLPASQIVKTRRAQSITVACLTFVVAATSETVAGAARELERRLARDGLAIADGADETWIVAQYDAIFSVGDRRNEVWIPLAPGHPWDDA